MKKLFMFLKWILMSFIFIIEYILVGLLISRLFFTEFLWLFFIIFESINLLILTFILIKIKGLLFACRYSLVFIVLSIIYWAVNFFEEDILIPDLSIVVISPILCVGTIIWLYYLFDYIKHSSRLIKK